jgi:hypothetical protein
MTGAGGVNDEICQWWREPETKGEWQDAVDAAYALLVLDAARQYGLVRGGPVPNRERCEDILSRGKQLGIEPRKDATAKVTVIPR